MGFFGYFAARSIGRALDGNRRSQLDKHRRDMEKLDAQMAETADKFIAKLRYRSVLGHPEFLGQPAAEPDRWWTTIFKWTDIAFNTVVAALLHGTVALLALGVTAWLRPDATWIGAGFVALIAYLLTMWLHSSHLWRPIVAVINRRFAQKGWPVARMLAELRDAERATLAAEKDQEAEAKRRPGIPRYKGPVRDDTEA